LHVIATPFTQLAQLTDLARLARLTRLPLPARRVRTRVRTFATSLRRLI